MSVCCAYMTPMLHICFNTGKNEKVGSYTKYIPKCNIDISNPTFLQYCNCAMSMEGQYSAFDIVSVVITAIYVLVYTDFNFPSHCRWHHCCSYQCSPTHNHHSNGCLSDCYCCCEVLNLLGRCQIRHFCEHIWTNYQSKTITYTVYMLCSFNIYAY